MKIITVSLLAPKNLIGGAALIDFNHHLQLPLLVRQRTNGAAQADTVAESRSVPARRKPGPVSNLLAPTGADTQYINAIFIQDGGVLLTKRLAPARPSCARRDIIKSTPTADTGQQGASLMLM